MNIHFSPHFCIFMQTGGLIIKTISYTITEQLVQRPNGEHVTHPCSFLA